MKQNRKQLCRYTSNLEKRVVEYARAYDKFQSTH